MPVHDFSVVSTEYVSSFFSPKVKVLQQLQQMPQHQGLTLHFVEDRLATLKNVIKEPALDKWNLYLGK